MGINPFVKLALRDRFPNDYEETITPTIAMMQDVFSGCVRIVCDMLASASVSVYRRGDNGKRSEATDRPEYRILHQFPNPFQTVFQWKNRWCKM